MWTLDPYVFKASSEGLKVFDLASESLIQLAEFTGGINSVWANDQHVYVATTNSGIYRALLTTVTGTIVFESYKSWPNITQNQVNYLHGNGDYLLATTLSGVDRYKISTDDHDYVFVDDATKCYQATTGDYYYIVSPNSSSDSLHTVYETGGGYIYGTDQQIIITATGINDIYVTEGTSIYGGNLIFLATTFGAYLIEEKRADEENCRKKIYLIET